MTGTLHVIGTPIGNLEDITLRALRVLKEVDIILCEDTRMTKRLLDTYGVPTRTMSYHTHSTEGKEDSIVAMLSEGKNLALVSDAGTPGISDPGVVLVSHIRTKLPTANIVAVPGPSALVAALSIAGLPAHEFTFFGFIPHKKGRETLFKEIAETKRTVVFYESPHRIEKTLASLNEYVPERTIAIARELTKIYEEIVSGTPAKVIEYFANNTDKLRGEFAVIIAP
ncbi:MAG: 16S rRNA (cytidine(1402)-2'-O)-methyltransferase [Candidatus Paceibacterota bacterium]